MSKKKSDDGWLEALETKVGQAAAELSRLRASNQQLAAKVEELQTSLGQAQEAAQGATNQADEAAWLDEKAQIRRRVEELAETLEGLLDVDADAGTEAAR